MPLQLCRGILKIKDVSNPVSRKEVISKVNKNEEKVYDICFVLLIWAPFFNFGGYGSNVTGDS